MVGRARGVIADLFAEAVGFYPGWGLSRSLRCISGDLVTRAGDVDWRSADAMVAGALAELLGRPASRGAALPEGARESAARLYAGVAVGQHCSGWARTRGASRGSRRLVLLRCHVGKRRRGRRAESLLLLQYRVWKKRRDGRVRRVRGARAVWRQVRDAHAEIERRLREGG